MEKTVENYLIRDIPVSTSAKPGNTGQQDWAALLGDYRRVSYRFGSSAETQKLQLFETAETLFYRIGDGRAKVLLSTGENIFRHQEDNYSTVFIGPDQQGIVYFQNGSDNFRLQTDR